jgi:hypothetical protein
MTSAMRATSTAHAAAQRSTASWWIPGGGAMAAVNPARSTSNPALYSRRARSAARRRHRCGPGPVRRDRLGRHGPGRRTEERQGRRIRRPWPPAKAGRPVHPAPGPGPPQHTSAARYSHSLIPKAGSARSPSPRGTCRQVLAPDPAAPAAEPDPWLCVAARVTGCAGRSRRTRRCGRPRRPAVPRPGAREPAAAA